MATITLSKRWRWLSGYSHGLPQRPLMGRIEVQGARPSDVAELDALMLKAVPAADLPPVAGPPAEALVRRLLYWVGEVQRHARIAVSPTGHVRAVTPITDGDGSFDVALPCRSGKASRDALQWLKQAVNQRPARTATRQPPPLDSLNELLEQLRTHAEPGYNQLHLLLAAYRRGISVTPLGVRLVRLGTGSRSRLVQSSLTDTTPALGVAIAKDKWLSSRMLAAIGVPCTHNDRVSNADEAVALAHRLGYPVVVKPADCDQGRGVSAHLISDDAVRKAYTEARAASANVLVERHVSGFGHRLTLHDGELVAVLRRIPGGVRGDGQHSVAELLARDLASPEVQRQRNMGRVQLDAQALDLLAERGLTPESVPGDGEFVLLRRRDNISAGGRLEHLSPASVHPDNLLAAQRAARALHLDLAGVDFLSADITRSWRENGAAICEVNAQPQFGVGPQGDNHDRVLQRLLGDEPQIPLHLRLCHGDEPDLHEQLCALRDRLGLQALSHRGGVWLGDTRLMDAGPDGWELARGALAERSVPSLLMALTPDEILTHGLPAPLLDGLHLPPGPDAHRPHGLAAPMKQALDWCALRQPTTPTAPT